MLKLRKSLLALGLLGLIAVPALAAGLWPNLPIVGSAAFCASENTAGVPGTTAVCASTAPAGPSIVTGLETVPADTHKAGGSSPQTVNLTMASLNANPWTVVAGSSATTNTLNPAVTVGGYVLTGSSALSPVTLTLPPSPIDGQQFGFTANQNIATLTVQSTADTVANAPTELTTSTTGVFGYKFKYDANTTTWHRLQ